jgi:hypothetical protein
MLYPVETADPCYTCFQAIEDVLAQEICELNFKNGAFATSITRTTSSVESLNILPTSAPLSLADKQTANTCLTQFNALCEMPHTTGPSHFNMMLIFMACVEQLWEIFKSDARGRDLYVAPTYFEQVFASLAQKVAGACKSPPNFGNGITRANRILVGPVINENSNVGEDGDNTHFGREFDRNLRGGFM